MNIIKNLTARIEEVRSTNKNPCKSYATEAAAEAATLKMATDATRYFQGLNFQPNYKVKPAHYVVFYVEAWGRWVGCINLSELFRRPEIGGGYLGFCKGFFTW